MVNKKAQAKGPGLWPSPPRPTSRRTSGTVAASPVSAEQGSSFSAESFKSPSVSPTDTREPLTTADVRSGKSSSVAAASEIDKTADQDADKVRPGGTVDETAKNLEDEPILPMTPTSPDPRSPGVALAFLQGETISLAPMRAGAVSHDMAVVEELLSAMKEMLGTLGATFDSLGEQTMKVATLPAAIDAVHQISTVRRQFEDQQKRQEQRMEGMKSVLLEEVKTKLYSRLRETASQIVKDIIRKEIAERVRQQLYDQIPQKLRDDVAGYKRQIMDVKISIHNSEARRHNALIRTDCIEEPLRPLLRPPPVPRHEWPLSVSIPEGAVQGGTASAYADKTPTIIPMNNRVLSDSDAAPSTGKAAARARLTRLEIGPPTPSPLFPRDLTSLMRLGPDEAKALVNDYGLVRVRYAAGTSQPTPTGDAEGETKEDEPAELEPIIEEESREEALNRFMSFIGVGFQVVPTSPTRGKAGANSPASLTRIH